MKRLTVSLLVVLGLVLGGFNLASANLIKNGDFSSSPLDEYWEADTGVIIADTGDSVYGDAALLSVAGTGGGSWISQNFTIASGTPALQISFSFLYDGAKFDLNLNKPDAELSFGKTDGTSETFANWIWADQDWYNGNDIRGTIITGSQTIDLLLLQDLDLTGNVEFSLNGIPSILKNGEKVYVDNVNVSAVPVPNALLLFGSGLAGLALFSRKFAGRNP